MKTMAKILSVATAMAGSAMVPVAAHADVSYNVGFASEYYYRGFFQKSSSASAGIDFEEGGFYAGAWTADVGEGLEVDRQSPLTTADRIPGYIIWVFRKKRMYFLLAIGKN